MSRDRVMAISILTAGAGLWMLTVSVFLLCVASAFFSPVSQGSIVQLVTAELRVSTNPVLRMPVSVTNFLGPTLGGADSSVHYTHIPPVDLFSGFGPAAPIYPMTPASRAHLSRTLLFNQSRDSRR